MAMHSAALTARPRFRRELAGLPDDDKTENKIFIGGADLPSLVRQRTFLYLGVLILLLAFGAPSGGFIEIQISFLLKNKLDSEVIGAAILIAVFVQAKHGASQRKQTGVRQLSNQIGRLQVPKMTRRKRIMATAK